MLRRIAIASACLASMVLCCALAWWQWERFSSAGGTVQNLGYVVQWPLFGLFPAFMFWRIRKLRRQAAGAGDQPGTKAAVQQPQPAYRPVGEDDELAAYNHYLAELHARDQQTS